MCKCPKCGAELDFTETIDCENYDEYTYVEGGYGECPKCKTEYWIDMVYKFSHYKVEEMKN